MKAALEVERLSKNFGGLRALHNIDLEVRQGEILGLIGPNGSGKTTLFNIITGFLKPDSGRIMSEGEEITHLKPHQVCLKGITRIFQLVKPFAQMTALQNLMVGSLYGRDPAEDVKKAKAQSREILSFVGLYDKADAVASSLTLAERKRLELGRALAAKPQLILLDELMAGLNPVETEKVMHLVQEVRNSNITVFMVEHIMKAVLGLSDRVIVLSNGMKIAEGAPREIIDNQEVIEAYLGKA